MNVDMSQFFQVFFDETEELLAEAEKLLLEIDVDNPDPEDINSIFRAAHSIKGGSSTFGLSDITKVTHVMETLLDEIRTGEKKLTPEHVEVFLAAKDVIKMLKEGHQYGSEIDQNAVDDVMKRLEALSQHETVSKNEAIPEKSSDKKKKKEKKKTTEKIEATYEIHLPQIKEEQLNALAEELETLGTVTKEMAPDGTAVIKLVTKESEDEIMSICTFMFSPDDIKISSSVAEGEEDDDDEEEEDENARGYGFFDNIELPNSNKEQSKEVKETPKVDESKKINEAKKIDDAKKTAASTAHASTSIRVGVDKVDQLINLMGELVITQAMIEQQSSSLDPMVYQRLLNSVSQLSRNSRDLQQAVMSMRMMPMEYVFSRFPRMVHDLAGKLGKKVELVTSGAATELDKGLIERIIDPLTHLVRNSVDHGIEMPDVRRNSGKSEVGKVYLSASHQGGNIVIEVNDDGAGLNRQKILEKAQQNGLHVSENMSDSDVWNLIFLPGFSTAEKVTDVSGRGVGMDVVKRNITEMGGFVDVRSSQGVGTMLSIYLPLTLAILDGMTIRIGNEIYIIPLGHVIESLQPVETDIKEITGQGKVLKVRGDYLTLISLADIFHTEARAKTPSEGIVIILEADGNRAALLVDELVGQQQVVVKNLEANYKKVPNVSGATILGDGAVALIVDVSGMMRAHSHSSGELPASGFAW